MNLTRKIKEVSVAKDSPNSRFAVIMLARAVPAQRRVEAEPSPRLPEMPR